MVLGSAPACLVWETVETAPFFARAATPDGTYGRLRWEGLGHRLTLVVNPGGRRVWLDYNETVTPQDAAAILFAAGVALVTRLRGGLGLHASAVALGDHAVILVGGKGAGKSTTALGLLRAGGRLVADDLAVVEAAEAGHVVRRGAPRLRLRPGPAAAFTRESDPVSAVFGGGEHRPDKRHLEVGGDGVPDAMPIAAVVVLSPRAEQRDDVQLEPLDEVRALVTLMDQRSLPYAIDRAGHGADMARLADLVGAVPVLDLRRPEGLDWVQPAADLLRDRVARLAA